jgi:hypothetical protein
MPRARSRSSARPPSRCSRALARTVLAPSGSRSSRRSKTDSSSAAATSRCCAPSCRSRSIRRRASSAAATSRARDAANSCRASAFSIASDTSSANAATRSSAPAGIDAPAGQLAVRAPHRWPPRTIGPAAAERIPRRRISAATAPPTSSKSSILTGAAARSIWPRIPRPSMTAVCPTGTAGAAPRDHPATIAARSGLWMRSRLVRCAPSSSPVSRVTAANTSSGAGARATSVATRRSAACSATSASRGALVRDASTRRL